MLPLTLLDLLCQRLSVPGNVVVLKHQARGCIRRVQQLAVHHAEPVSDSSEIPALLTSRATKENMRRNDFSLRERLAQRQVQALKKLGERVVALKEAAVMSTMGTSAEGSHIPEVELQDIYRDLLSSPDTDVIHPTLTKHDMRTEKQCLNVARVLEERLHDFETAISNKANGNTLSSKLLVRIRRDASDKETNYASPLQEAGSSLRSLVNRLHFVLEWLHGAWSYTEADSSRPRSLPVPLGLLSNAEWETLLQTCLQSNDAPASEVVLDLMKRSGLVPSDEQYDAVLDWYATNGIVEQADTFFSRLAIDLSRDRQRDLLIKARVRSKRLEEACALIHSFETTTTPAPIQSYTRVIQALFSQRGPGSEQLKAQAWDMFSHMRYVAHATADKFLYTVMIRACAESVDPEPERALDLFEEMTVDNKAPPTTHAYNAVILACARSKKFALEAFRLAREMLNSHRDAYGEIPASLRPDNVTFRALLEAAKRLGDLPRARWILAQMTNEAQSMKDNARVIYVDERVMTHVFHTYASYRPPFRREAVEFASGEKTETQRPEMHDTSSSLGQQVDIAAISQHSGIPQSRQDVIKEVSTLWERVLEDRQESTEHVQDQSGPHRRAFGRVSLTPALLNAYMAVHYVHSPPSAAYKVYSKLFKTLGVPRDGFTYALALEAYAIGKRASGSELRLALSVARDIWKDWGQLEDAGVSQLSCTPVNTKAVDARVVERAWSAMMRLLALNGQLIEAIELLHQFVERYPPDHVKKPSAPNPMRATRTSLYAERPIVRLTERSSVPEDRISPFLTFKDLNLLHQRAIAAKRTDYIAYITWVAKAYEGSLRHRRGATLRAAAVAR